MSVLAQVAVILGFLSLAAPPKRVLFVGNSFTYGNDVPGLVAALGGFQVGMVARDGMTLEAHWREGEAARRLAEESWDVLVLQEQSSRPLSDPDLMEAYVRRFASAARKAGAEVVLFETWSRADEPETEAPRAAVYHRAGDAVGAKVAPIGTAWSRALAEHPGLPLHASDGLHASPTGSYLAACVLVGVLSMRPPLETAAKFGGDPEVARTLRRIAWQTVTDASSR